MLMTTKTATPSSTVHLICSIFEETKSMLKISFDHHRFVDICATDIAFGNTLTYI